MKKIITIILIALCFGCEKKGVTDISFKVSYSIEGEDVTKSTEMNDAMVSDINIFLYDKNGQLTDCGYTTQHNINLTVREKEEYIIYALANIGNMTSDISLFEEDGIKQYCHTISDYEDIVNSSGGIPMSYCSSDYRQISSGDEIQIVLKRFISCINIRLDKSQLQNVSDFNVKSITLKNVPGVMNFFKSSKAETAAEILPQGETKEESRLSSIYDTGVSFYTLENMQGTLLSNNLEQSSKVFPSGSPYSSLCTYIEMIVEYRSNIAYNPDLPYRFYLGNNNYSNFDIERNTKYDILITPRETGINEDSWRIDKSNLKYLVTGITLSPTSYTFSTIGSTLTIEAAVTPSYAENKSLTWTSSNTSVAQVSQTGIVTAVADGNCIISAHSKDGTSLSAECSVLVESYIWPQSVTVTPSDVQIYKDETVSLTVTILPENSSSKGIIWSSSDSNIATVNSEGVVTGKNGGNCQITATAQDMNEISGSCSVLVKEAGFTISPSEMTIYRGYSKTISYNAEPSGTPIWESSDNTIAAVDGNGKVTAINEGYAEISAACNGITRICTVTAVEPQINLSTHNITAYQGNDCTISLSLIIPYTENVQWTSSDEDNLKVTPSSNKQSCIIKGLAEGTYTLTATANGVSSLCEIKVLPAVKIIPPAYLELANYALWPEKKNTELPSSAQFTIEKDPTATLTWIIKRYGGSNREDISMSSSGLLTTGENASGQYSIQAKASTGEFYSNIISMEIYYFLMYQDELFFVSGEWSEGGAEECDVEVSMGTKWYLDRKPVGYFEEMQDMDIIFDKNKTVGTVIPSLYKVGETYLLSAKYYNLTFNQSFIHSAYYEISPRSYVFESLINYGNKVRFRVTEGDGNYYLVKKEGGYSDDPTNP